MPRRSRRWPSGPIGTAGSGTSGTTGWTSTWESSRAEGSSGKRRSTMGSRHQLVTTTPTDVEIVMSRTFDAPRDLVFEAHSSCEHLSNWWGPRDSKFLECDVDFRVGGSWKVVIDHADGPITFFGEYLEIVPPERISWTFGFDDEPGGPETYLFEEHDGKTTVTSKAVFPSKE